MSDDTANAPTLTQEDKQALVQLARQTLNDYLSKGEPPDFQPASTALTEQRAAFVTLRVRETGELRGCIGEVIAREPLWDCVRNMALAAATEDPRFPPVTAAELPGLHIEISALTPMMPILPQQVVVGRHGLMIVKGFSRGLLLPQVPVEQGWDREEFLRGVCHKAWLPANAWKDKDAQLYGFEAEVWEEE